MVDSHQWGTINQELFFSSSQADQEAHRHPAQLSSKVKKQANNEKIDSGILNPEDQKI